MTSHVEGRIATPLRQAAVARTRFLPAGNPRPVLRAASAADATGVVAVVLETEGSTYAHAGALAYFDATRQVGWLSGGCLEPAIAQAAAHAAQSRTLRWMEVDTRDDEALLSGSAIGCRGRLRLALLPMGALDGLPAVFDTWRAGGRPLALEIGATGTVSASTGDAATHASLPVTDVPWPTARRAWTVSLPRPPEVVLFGAGPESTVLLDLLCDLGWHTTLVERRSRWHRPQAPVDCIAAEAPANYRASADTDVALVMHHDFELDREALVAIAATDIPFVGLLGPHRRREDLFKLLSPAQRAAIAPRLRSPVGLPLGGQGPEAIALSIAAQLQAWRASDAVA